MKLIRLGTNLNQHANKEKTEQLLCNKIIVREKIIHLQLKFGSPSDSQHVLNNHFRSCTNTSFAKLHRQIFAITTCIPNNPTCLFHQDNPSSNVPWATVPMFIITRNLSRSYVSQILSCRTRCTKTPQPSLQPLLNPTRRLFYELIVSQMTYIVY